MADAVSKIGTPTISSGTASAYAAEDFITPMQVYRLQGEAQEECAGIPHEVLDAGLEVVPKKRHTRPDDSSGQRGRIEPVRLCREKQQAHGGDGGDTRRTATRRTIGATTKVTDAPTATMSK